MELKKIKKLHYNPTKDKKLRKCQGIRENKVLKPKDISYGNKCLKIFPILSNKNGIC